MLFHNLVKEELGLLENEIEMLIPSGPEEVYGMLVPYIKRGGKRIRPILSFLCCRIAGGKSQNIIRPAAIIELFHNFTLIHDDIEDNSEVRRGEPTLHKIYGIPIALNSGDAFYTAIWQAIVELDASRLGLKDSDGMNLSRMYASAFRNVVEGQGIELSWYNKGRFDISEKEYIEMVSGKTAALLGLSCELGAYLGGAGKEERKTFMSVGKHLGLSFQIRDDVLNITGEFERYKKEIGGDVSEGKRTLLVAHALKHANDGERAVIRRVLSSHSKDKADITEVIDIFRTTGAIDYANKKAAEFRTNAMAAIDDLRDCNEKDALVEVAEYMLSRKE